MSPTEAALRAAVAAAPDAALPRLVLADYLDDHAQPHPAAALRLDVALAAERPWADRYWQLKAEQPPGFPADLGRLSDRQPLLCGVPDDWRSRWRAVRAFVSRWCSRPLRDAGDPLPEAVAQAEAVAGRALPAGVREWVSLVAEAPDVYDRLCETTRYEDMRATGLARGRDTAYCVCDDDLAQPDPPTGVLLWSDIVPGVQRFSRETAGVAELALRLLALNRTLGAGTLDEYKRLWEPDAALTSLNATATGRSQWGRLLVFEWPGVLAMIERRSPEYTSLDVARRDGMTSWPPALVQLLGRSSAQAIPAAGVSP